MTRKYEKSTGWKKRKLLAQVAWEYQLAQQADLCSVWLASGYVEPCYLNYQLIQCLTN